MTRSVITGSGSFVPQNPVTNEMLGRIMDTSDEWIRERSGVESRCFAPEGMTTSDVGFFAARAAIEAAGLAPADIDLLIFATMTPDHYFPGCGSILQRKLGLRDVPCFDIRQQCTGFVYGLQLADAQIRSGFAKTVLLVGAEVHIGFMPWSRSNNEYMHGRCDTPPTPEEFQWNSRYRHLTVLFGDGGAAVVLRAADDGERGVVDSLLHADGKDYERLHVPGVGSSRRPYVDAGQVERGEVIPVMDGRFVFRNATTRMLDVSREILHRNGVAPSDLSLVLMHQANLRINEYVREALGIPSGRVPHNIQRFGNTTAATIPLLWDECAREGRIAPGDLVLMVAFGAGMTWGATLVRA